jgi:hypothetical protein
MIMKNDNDDSMMSALTAGTELPEDVRRTLGLSETDDTDDVLLDDEPSVTPKPATAKAKTSPVKRQVEQPKASRGKGGKADTKLGTAGRLKIDVETLRRDSTHQLGHVIDEAIAFRLKRAVFEQKMTRGMFRTERAVIEAALSEWLDRYDSGDLAEAA